MALGCGLQGWLCVGVIKQSPEGACRTVVRYLPSLAVGRADLDHLAGAGCWSTWSALIQGRAAEA
jgi:hypothetical protein